MSLEKSGSLGDCRVPVAVIEQMVDPRDLARENILLTAQLKAAQESSAFLEDCLVEMAEVVYA